MPKISFPVDSLMLNGTLFYPEKIKNENPAILFIHGWMSSEVRYKEQAEALAKIGFVCMTFDMRGHGNSEGDLSKYTRQDFITDVIGAYDYLKKQKLVDSESISIVGSSFGAYLATLLSKERKVKSLVLRVPANYPNEGFNEPQMHIAGKGIGNSDIIQWRLRPLDKAKTYSLHALNLFSGDVLIIESENDKFIPHQTIKNYINAIQNKNKLTYTLMKKAEHSLVDRKSQLQYIKILTEWFKDKV